MGIEAAVRAKKEGYDVVVFEKKEVGAHVATWAHVEFFSPWEMNRSAWGKAELIGGEGDVDGDKFPTGRDYLERYLRPLAKTLGDGLEEWTQVKGVSRQGQLKGEGVGDRAQDEGFELLVSHGGEERYEAVDILIDTSGVLGQPGRLGPQGMPAIGEERFEGRIIYGIPTPEQVSEQLQGDPVLLVGDGHSAMTSLSLIAEGLGAGDNSGQLWWSYREAGEPRTVIEDDPLPQRAALDRLGNRAARQEVTGVQALDRSQVRRIEEGEERALTVVVERDGGQRPLDVDWIVANVGYRPDLGLTRELQVHHCYASEGPMKLAAHLMASAGGGGDCLEQSSGGAEVLTTPEPNFFVLGAKSYGRNSNFLLRLGFEQIEQVFAELLQ